MSYPIESYFYIVLNALAFGNAFAFRASIGPIWDVLVDELDTTSSGISLLSSSYWICCAPANIPWGLFLQIYLPEWGTFIGLITVAVASFLLPMIDLTSHSLIFGSIIRGIAGILTVQMWLCAISMGSQRFKNKNVGIISAFTLVLGTGKSVICGFFQAVIYEEYQDWKSIFYYLSATSLLYGMLLLIIKWKESGTITKLEFRRRPNPDGDEMKEEAGRTTTEHGESTTISAREAENMKLSIWEQTKLNLKQASKLPLNWIVGLFGTCAATIFLGIFQLWFIPFLMVRFEYSRTLSSILRGLALAGSCVGVIVFGEIARRFGPRKPLLYCGIAMFSTFTILLYAPNLPLLVPVVLSIVIGGGSGTLIIVFMLAREYNWYHGSAETATALINMLTVLGGFIGQYAIGALLEISYEGRDGGTTANEGSREYTARDYQFAFGVAPAVVLLLFILTLFLKETNGKNLTYDDETAGEEKRGNKQKQNNIQKKDSP